MNCHYRTQKEEKTLGTLKKIAKDAAIREVQRQSIDIVDRARNKLYLAMLQAGISPRTIQRVQDELYNKVEPWYQRYLSDPQDPAAGSGVADFALQEKLKEYGVEFVPVKEEM